MKRLAITLALLAFPHLASAEGLLTVKGAAAVQETLDRMEAAAKAEGVIVVRVDHAPRALAARAFQP